MDNVEEMDKFLEKYNFPKLDKEEMKNPRVSRRKEILKIRAEINAKGNKRDHSKNQQNQKLVL